jgi:hypothetical protein
MIILSDPVAAQVGTVPLLAVESAVPGSNIDPGTTYPDLTFLILFSHSGKIPW